MARFLDVFEDATKNGCKILQEEYLSEGKYPIIDQGQKYIAGYTNREEGLYTDVPAILFGDHTRIIKYVDMPFFLGADGVKLLKAKSKDANYRYLYYALCSAKIPDTGYNRHFKWLKELDIPIPEVRTQEKIVVVLNKITDLIDSHKKQLLMLDELVKSRFIEMFGDIETNPQGLPVLSWREVFITTTGKLDSNAMVKGGQYPFFTCAKENYWIDTYAFDCEALLLSGNNAAGIYDVKHYKGKFNAYQRTYVLRLLNECWSYTLFKRQLEDKLLYLQNQSKGTNTRYLTLGILNNLRFIIPPIEAQAQYTTFIKQIDKSKFEIQQSLEKLKTVKKSLLRQFF